MILNSDSSKPIYVQISEWLENEIISGNFNTDDKMYSQYQLAELFNINPATAAKGLNILAEEQILYKKRGLGMFVSEGARARILDKRKNETLKELVETLVIEAKRLSVSEADLIKMIQETSRRRSDDK
ncbi:GntR family transcriptional regulator [Lederbergia wuyishanensis]|uniref:DNA-binding transcriptional regulator YhcF (GntR family) n=1 Tax=Lederbergia wuyishanensis TaxID=1347903 RepID=A0ABU0DAX2_9BACI|nr:GntR family transcriptional regulator [Lederbergia wuyishanensis]MCJ8010055.1 GntR family transcriptional regulator [Lederbergia wuyishanensis]MDQ0345569.1 DNA-binding transcriptional regulator YhcF (GntR family) [Lederbergia wuyishanensis]